MKKISEFFSKLFGYIDGKINAASKKKMIIISACLFCITIIGVCACVALVCMEPESKTVVSSEQRENSVEIQKEEPLPQQEEAPEEVKDEADEDPDAKITVQESASETVKKASDSYTCLLTVPDKGGLRTDMIMLLVFRMGEKQIDLISIPRDTKVDGKKINAVAISGGKVNLEKLSSKIEELTGIAIDSYMFVDIECVKKTIDMFGGVMFNVPRKMYYQDPYQNLYIDINPGNQLIDGNKGEQLLRFRRYANGDIGRTEIQRQFMVEAFKQHAKIENLAKIPQWFEMANGHIKTNMNINSLTSIASAVVSGSFGINSRVMPHSLSGNYVICNKAAMSTIAKELGY